MNSNTYQFVTIKQEMTLYPTHNVSKTTTIKELIDTISKKYPGFNRNEYVVHKVYKRYEPKANDIVYDMMVDNSNTTRYHVFTEKYFDTPLNNIGGGEYIVLDVPHYKYNDFILIFKNIIESVDGEQY